jgi:hypothetical protein
MKINQLMLVREVFADYFENHAETTLTVRGQKEEFL